MRLEQAQAQAMASRDKLDHKSSVASMSGSGGRDTAPRPPRKISAPVTHPRDAFAGWRDSPQHRANMLLAGETPHGHAGRVCAQLEIQGFGRFFSQHPSEPRGGNPGDELSRDRLPARKLPHSEDECRQARWKWLVHMPPTWLFTSVPHPGIIKALLAAEYAGSLARASGG